VLFSVVEAEPLVLFSQAVADGVERDLLNAERSI
jgi:hypothetical protein